MKLATWNVNSLSVRLPQLLQWLAANQPDAMVLQETKLTDDRFPAAEIAAAGWQAVWFGQRTYNGVALLSKTAAADVVRNIPGHADPQARLIAGTVGTVRVVGAYFPNGQAPGTDKFAYKMAWLEALAGWLRDELERHPRLALLGDFNIAPEDRDVHDPAEWRDQVLCSVPERERLQALFDLGFVDVFRCFEQPQQAFSWWDYRAAAFRRNRGLRIDLILASPALAATSTGSGIDTGPRGREQPSDHTPVWASFS